MTRLIVDSWAWIEYFRGTKTGSRAKHLMEEEEVFTHSVTISEVISKLNRRGSDLEAAKRTFASIPKVVETTRGNAVQVGEVHASVRKVSPNFSMADAYVLEAARRLGLKVLTGDPDFEGLEEAEFLR